MFLKKNIAIMQHTAFIINRGENLFIIVMNN
jgi:hypothetical protein